MSKLQKIRPENPLVCSHCGSEMVQQKVWIDANSGEKVPATGVLLHDCWCTNCEQNRILVQKDEFQEQQNLSA